MNTGLIDIDFSYFYQELEQFIIRTAASDVNQTKSYVSRNDFFLRDVKLAKDGFLDLIEVEVKIPINRVVYVSAKFVFRLILDSRFLYEKIEIGTMLLQQLQALNQSFLSFIHNSQ